MSNYAAICDGVVVNLVQWDGQTEYSPANIDQLIPVGENCVIGSTYTKNGFKLPATKPHPDGFKWDGTKWQPVFTPQPHRIEELQPEPNYEVK